MKTTILTFVCLLITVLTTGCAISTPISSPNGKIGHAINCSAVTFSHCYQTAGEMCGGGGYVIIDKMNKPHGFFSGADRTLVVECKEQTINIIAAPS